MSNIYDVQTEGAKHKFAIIAPFKTTAAVSRGNCVCINTDGELTTPSGGAQHKVIGVAVEDGAVGDTVNVLVYGFCDFINTDGAVTGSDFVLYTNSSGLAVGATESDLVNDPTLAFYVVGKNLGADTDDDTGYCWVCPGMAGTGDGV